MEDLDSLPAERRLEIEFVLAASNGELDEVAQALTDGVNVDAIDVDGSTALMAAAFQGRTHIVRLLLDRGANINSVQDKFQWTPLIAAAYGGHHQVVQLLLEKNADLAFLDSEGNSALDWAIQQRQVDAGTWLRTDR